MPRLRDRVVLGAGPSGLERLGTAGSALVDGYDEEAGRYPGLVLPTDDMIVVKVTDATFGELI